MSSMTKKTRSDWAYAALIALGEGGERSIAVQPLARSLGVTKGSFYWHFGGRDELVLAALELWEEQGTTRVIETLDLLPDPRERAHRLLAAAIDTVPHLRTEAALSAAASRGDPVVGPVYARVCERRLAYLESTYAELGCARPERWAQAAFAAYLGVVQLAAMRPSPLGPADLEELVGLLQERLVP